MIDFSVPSKALVNIDAASITLTDTILGHNAEDLSETLKIISKMVSVKHISYIKFGKDKSVDTTILTAFVTYSKIWQTRYFLKRYAAIDPVVLTGRHAVIPFDWGTLPADDPETKAFIADSLKNDVGRNGISIPVRNPHGAISVVSFTSDMAKDEWDTYTSSNLAKLQVLSVLIDTAASINFKLPPLEVKLSRREEQCLIWAARGKTYQEIAELLGLGFGSVKSHLDNARHKLRCVNLTHAVAVAIASGIIPAKAVVNVGRYEESAGTPLPAR